MDQFKQIQTFVAVAQKGSISAVAATEGLVPAVIGRRLDALETRLGVKLLLRSTRRISLTPEGSVFLEDCQRILLELEQAEASLAADKSRVSGHLKLTAPAGYGRKHVAPLVPAFIARHPQVSVALDLSDRVVDLINEGFDCAVRVGDFPDSSLVSVKLAHNRRLVVGAPAYFARYGRPQHPNDLQGHQCLGFGPSGTQQRGWLFTVGKKIQTFKINGTLECTDTSVLTQWAREGHGLAWRSEWEVAADLEQGSLISVLDEFTAPDNGVYVVFPERKHLPMRVRAWVDFLKQQLSTTQVLTKGHS